MFIKVPFIATQLNSTQLDVELSWVALHRRTLRPELSWVELRRYKRAFIVPNSGDPGEWETLKHIIN